MRRDTDVLTPIDISMTDLEELERHKDVDASMLNEQLLI
jgi:hypothetical protein